MATKLKKMRLTSVDLVRAGANPKADICLYKSADGMYAQDNDDQVRKDDDRMIRIDKSRFDDDELKTYEALIAKAMVDPEAGEEEMEDEKPPVAQKKRRVMPEFEKADDDFFVDDEEELDKGCKNRKSADADYELFKSAFERQEARIAELEKSLAMKEFEDVAKKYEVLGEKDLAKSLYDMFQADENLYKSYIASLDKSLELVEKSGLFAEIGKSTGASGAATTVGKAEAIAKSYMEKDPELSYDMAVAKAWENNPELIAEYDREYNA